MSRSEDAWLAAYLYTAEPWETFLIDAIKPFVAVVFDQGLAEQFFFIRYWERGPHIRLRFKGAPQVLEREVRPVIESFFTDYFERHPSQRTEPAWVGELPPEKKWFPNDAVQFIPYEPEVERYGGPAGILIAERQFEISSRTVLALLEESESWTYDRALGAAIQLHLAFAWALGMDLEEARHFFGRVSETWFARAYGFAPDLAAEKLEERQALTLEAFADNFTAQKEALVSYHQMVWHAFIKSVEFEQGWLNSWLRGMAAIACQLQEAQEKKRLVFPARLRPNAKLNVPPANQQVWSILGSYVHMTNNRLGILNRDEAYLGYLIKKSLEYVR